MADGANVFGFAGSSNHAILLRRIGDLEHRVETLVQCVLAMRRIQLGTNDHATADAHAIANMAFDDLDPAVPQPEVYRDAGGLRLDVEQKQQPHATRYIDGSPVASDDLGPAAMQRARTAHAGEHVTDEMIRAQSFGPNTPDPASLQEQIDHIAPRIHLLTERADMNIGAQSFTPGESSVVADFIAAAEKEKE